MTQKEAAKLLFLDTETTGNGPDDRLCQVCFKIGSELEVKNFKPPIPISVKAMSITHITNEMVEGEEAFEGSETSRELQKLLDENILVAHNARFDIAMLEAEGMTVPRHIDTLRLARYLDEAEEIPEYGLQYLRYHYGVSVEANAHSADGDVLVLEAVFEHLFNAAQAKASDVSREQILERMMQISAQPSLIRRFAFGKHIGRSIAEVLVEERSYLEWLLRSKLQDSPDDEDWIYTLRYHLHGEQEIN